MRYVTVALAGLVFLMVSTTMARGESAMIENGKHVTFDYTLTVNGQVADTSEGKKPIEYTQGQGMMVSGLEKQMEGMKVGEEKVITVSPEEGYGLVNKDAIVEFPKSNFPPDIIPKKGMVVDLQTKDGKSLSAVIEDVKDATVTLNFNHPLAGKELKFDVKIVDIQ